MLRSLLTIGSLQVVVMLVLMIRTKALALMLGPEMVGVMAVVDKLFATVAQTVALSMPFAAVRFLPEVWTRDRAEFAALFRRMRNILLLLAVVATAAAGSIALLDPSWLGDGLRPYGHILVAAAFTLPVLALVPFLQNAVASRLEQNRAMLFTLLHAVVFAGTAIAGVAWAGLFGFYMLYAAFGLALAALGMRWVLRGSVREPAAPRLRERFALPRRVWIFSFALLALAFLTPYAAWFVHYDVLRKLGPETAGWMQAAIGISLAVRGVMGAAHAIFLTPNVNRGGEPAERMAWANDFFRMLALLVALLVPPLLLVPDVAVRILYSAEFLPGVPFVMLFVLMEVVALMVGVHQSLILAFDHIALHVTQNVAAQLVLLGVTIALLGRVGVVAIPIGGLAGQFLLFGVTTTFLRRRHGLRIPGHLRAVAGYAVFAMAAAGAAGLHFGPGLRHGLAPRLGIYLLLVAGLFALLTPDERRRLLALRPGRRPATPPALAASPATATSPNAAPVPPLPTNEKVGA